jgi:hypothetical protein
MGSKNPRGLSANLQDKADDHEKRKNENNFRKAKKDLGK